MAAEKEYTGSITLGATTPTYDLESKPENEKETGIISEASIKEATQKFIGHIQTNASHIFSHQERRRCFV